MNHLCFEERSKGERGTHRVVGVEALDGVSPALKAVLGSPEQSARGGRGGGYQ